MLGDACDSDTDNDGILNDFDNCIFKFNPLQIDGDGKIFFTAYPLYKVYFTDFTLLYQSVPRTPAVL